MIEMRVRTRSEIPAVLRKARRANIESLGHAGAAIRLTARRSIRKSAKASLPGKPPRTRHGQLRRSIVYAVERHRGAVIIGPGFRGVGRSAQPHEFGGPYRGDRYPARPFMGPALEKTAPRLPKLWAGSVR